MRLKRVFLSVHKWIGLVVGIQIVLWMLSGLVMAVLPIEEVRGEHNIADQPPVRLDGIGPLAPLDTVIAAAGGDAVAATLTTLAGEPVYEVKKSGGATALIDARSAAVLTPISEALARQVAEADFAGDRTASAAILVTQEGGDYRGRLPAWRISFDDPDDTRIYVAANDGRVSARRSGTWRLYDFFWMLHIMDYSARENFNSPWMVGFAAGGLAVALSGVPLLWWGVLRPMARRRRRT
ncbi:MAG: PepSY domain-containing protein [Micropepsaceae bacterium]